MITPSLMRTYFVNGPVYEFTYHNTSFNNRIKPKIFYLYFTPNINIIVLLSIETIIDLLV